MTAISSKTVRVPSRPREISATASNRIGPMASAESVTFYVATALVTLVPWIAIEHYHVNPFYVVAAVAITPPAERPAPIASSAETSVTATAGSG